MSLARLAWSVAATAAGPGLPLWLGRRVAQGKEFAARLGERRGIAALPRPEGRLAWVHGASVGETLSVVPLIHALRARHPDLAIVLTSGTVTSARLLAARLGGARARPEQSGVLPDTPGVVHQFVPLDRPAWVAEFLNHWRPDLALFVESELWPNMLAALARRGTPAALVNARMSPRSAARWAMAPGMARAVLSSFRLVLAQSEADAERLARLGAPAPLVPGNLKWAAPCLPADAAELARLRQLIGHRPVWAMASTHDGDEAIALAADAQVRAAKPDLLTIIVPRHPERGEALAAGMSHATRKATGGDPTGQVWLCDTLGELGLIYRLAPLVVMGKSFNPPGGGQNPLEPARLGAAVAFGPLMHNFADIANRLVAADAAARVADPAGLGALVTDLLKEPAVLARMGQAAARVATEEAGVLDRILEALGPLLPLPA